MGPSIPIQKAEVRNPHHGDSSSDRAIRNNGHAHTAPWLHGLMHAVDEVGIDVYIYILYIYIYILFIFVFILYPDNHICIF